MTVGKSFTDLPVLLLHNLDQSWDPVDIQDVLSEVANLESALLEENYSITNVLVSNSDLPNLLRKYNPNKYIVFNWCEGLPGVPHSEALVALTLEILNFSYTGSTSEVLGLSWDKDKVKHLLKHHDIPTPDWRIYNSTRPDSWNCFPSIVKPAFEHCSSGVTTEAVVLNPEELRNRIAYVLDVFHQPVLVEDFIDGREFHVSLWGNGVIQMLPPAEMDFTQFEDVHDRLCTFEAKFSPDSRHYNQVQIQIPARLEEDEYKNLARTALAAYQSIGCRDYARMDIRLRDGIFYVLDVNPNADISSDASMAYAAELAGYSYGAMISHLISLAALRHPVLATRP